MTGIDCYNIVAIENEYDAHVRCQGIMTVIIVFITLQNQSVRHIPDVKES
jgi:hypothetical protein